MTLTIGRNYLQNPVTNHTALHEYRPRGTAQAIFTDKRQEVLVSGPYGTGKSRACLEKLHLVCLSRPNVRALMSRSRYDWLRDSASRTFMDHVAAEHIAAGQVHVYGGTVPKQIQYMNGSTIDVVGLNDINRVMSAEYDLIYVQEATELTLDVWERLGGRLRGSALSYRQLLADCNPSHDQHFLYLRAQEGKLVMYESTHEENPLWFNVEVDEDGEFRYSLTESGEDYIGRLESQLSGIWLQRGRYGKWVGAEGAIYDNFNPSVHVIDAFDIPVSWSRYWTVDFGYEHPFVCQMWAEDPDGRLFLYKEIYQTHKLVEDHAKAMLELAKGEPKPQKVITDHDAEDRATLEKHLSMKVTPAKKDVSPGIQATHKRFRVAKDGKARIYIFKDALGHRPDQRLADARKPTCTAKEISGYIWKPGEKEEPLKVNDDGCDAMRYMVADRDLIPAVNIRWM
jgi:PBSX family phage terminase large subunit